MEGKEWLKSRQSDSRAYVFYVLKEHTYFKCTYDSVFHIVDVIYVNYLLVLLETGNIWRTISQGGKERRGTQILKHRIKSY